MKSPQDTQQQRLASAIIISVDPSWYHNHLQMMWVRTKIFKTSQNTLVSPSQSPSPCGRSPCRWTLSSPHAAYTSPAYCHSNPMDTRYKIWWVPLTEMNFCSLAIRSQPLQEPSTEPMSQLFRTLHACIACLVTVQLAFPAEIFILLFLPSFY